jgi:hypothetical protein
MLTKSNRLKVYSCSILNKNKLTPTAIVPHKGIPSIKKIWKVGSNKATITMTAQKDFWKAFSDKKRDSTALSIA